MNFSKKKHGQSKPLLRRGSMDVLPSRNISTEPHERLRRSQNKSKEQRFDAPPPIDRCLIDGPVQTNGHHTPTTERVTNCRTHCLCESHLNKQLFEGHFHLAVDQLFDLIFGSNEFVRTYRHGQHFFDETATEWVRNEITHCRERMLTYKVPYDSAFFGKNTISSRESQVITNEMLGSYYTINTDVFNEGVKFSDTFSLMLRFCLIQKSSNTAHLRVTAQVHYRKSVNPVMKHLIELNAYSASQNGLKELNVRLTRYAIDPMSFGRVENKASTVDSTVERVSQTNHENIAPIVPSNQTVSDRSGDFPWSNSDKTIYLLFFLIVCLFWIHMYLYLKLIHVDFLLDLLSKSNRR